ncbi:MAG: MBL fold metallo-hydrolase [Candidatus Njordarchaeales archaeon]
MRLIDNIHMLTISFVNVYIIERGEKLILIDAGLENSPDYILPYIESIGHRPEDLLVVIITHKHGDHTLGLRGILERTKARVAAHKLEAEGIKERAGIDTIDILLENGDEIESLRVIHTPGHTPGHICLLDKKTGALFIGDLVYEENGELLEIPHKYSEDPIANREAIKSLARVDFKHMLLSHGRPILNTGKEALLELIKKLS